MSVKQIQENEFEKEVLKSGGVTVVDFYASWCGPCKMLSPILDSLSVELKNKAKFYKVDVDETDRLTKEYGILAVPTLIFFKDGKDKSKMSGLKTKQAIQAEIERLIQ